MLNILYKLYFGLEVNASFNEKLISKIVFEHIQFKVVKNKCR